MGTASIREDWEGRSVDGKFALLEWLGGSAESGVFLTVLGGVQRAVIKLIPAEGADTEAFLAQWEMAKALSHIHLMRLLEAGRCTVEGTDVLYVVTEHAEKVLSKFLPEKPLQGHEASNIFTPVLEALSYLHENGFVHGHIKPSNILVCGGELKISCDDFFVAGGVSKPPRKPSIYDAPEVAAGTLTAAADVWSVGISLVEALTQRPPARDAGNVPIVSGNLPRPFPDIVRDSLRPEPGERCSIGDIQGRLAVRSEARPESVPEARSEARAQGRLGRKTSAAASEQVAAAPAPVAAAGQPMGRWETEEPVPPLPTLFEDIEEANLTRFPITPILIIAVVALAVVAVLVMRSNGIKISWPFQTQSAPAVRQQPAQPPQSTTATPSDAESGTSATPSAASPSSSATQPQTPAPSTNDTQSAPATGEDAPQQTSPTKSTGEASSAAGAGKAAPKPQTAAAAASATQSTPAANQVEPQTPGAAPASSEATGATTEGAVASRVLPNVSQSAIESMHGPVVVETRVFVDRSGGVLSAAYITQGPGNYFARIALRAAQSWKFTPPQTHGHPQPSVWTLRFYFTHGKTEVTATQVER